MSTYKNGNETEIKTVKVRAKDGTKRGLTEGTRRFWFTKDSPRSAGRPPGSKSLKEFARDYLLSVPDDKKREYLASLPQDLVWRMAEGNPHSTEDVRHTVAPTPIMTLSNVDSSTSVLPTVEHVAQDSSTLTQGDSRGALREASPVVKDPGV